MRVRLPKALRAHSRLSPKVFGEVTRIVEAERGRDFTDRRIVLREQQTCTLASTAELVGSWRKAKRPLKQTRQICCRTA